MYTSECAVLYRTLLTQRHIFTTLNSFPCKGVIVISLQGPGSSSSSPHKAGNDNVSELFIARQDGSDDSSEKAFTNLYYLFFCLAQKHTFNSCGDNESLESHSFTKFPLPSFYLPAIFFFSLNWIHSNNDSTFAGNSLNIKTWVSKINKLSL